jgi:nickel-dependent lactate racemase
MQSVTVPWGMWYNDKGFEFTFPDDWQLTVPSIKGGADIGDGGIRRALQAPIGAPRLRDLARGRRDAAILIDDLTRPTPSYRLLPYVLEELAAAGIDESKVCIVCAIASHRPMTRQDFIKKIGLDLVERLHVVNHNACDNLEFMGRSSLGIPIWVNREFARADVKIALGMITPRGSFFGGGPKLLLPGACGRETIYLNHSYCPDAFFRQHISEVAHLVGLEYIVNALLNTELDVTGLVVGHPDQAFEAGVALGKDIYATQMPEAMDIVICNAWPKDSEMTQASMALVPLFGSGRKVVKEGGSLVIATASPEGLGYHSVMGPGTLFRELGRARSASNVAGSAQRRELLFSPNLNHYDVHSLYGQGMLFFKTWESLLTDLRAHHGPGSRVCVFPCGPMQYAVD